MNIKSVLKSAIISFVLVCIVLFICAGLVYFNIINERLATIIIFTGVIISTFIGAFIVAKVNETKILLHSILVGVVLAITIFIITIIVNNSPALHPRTLALIGSMLASSFLGAIFANR